LFYLSAPDYPHGKGAYQIILLSTLLHDYDFSCLTLAAKSFQLLETMMKNCGEYVHFEVVEQHILQEMVRIVQKKVISLLWL
jgi:hypothetical protein